MIQESMLETNPIPVQTDSEQSATPPRRRRIVRLAVFGCVLFVVLMLALLPPLINVNQFQRRIARNIGLSLGRPVHMDRVSLTLLPMPGFTLENFVVDENPEFGSEPVIRADSVHATLRVSSLWRRRFEFSTISLTEPSVNLVHLANGKWNIEEILLQAARIEAAPTVQKYVSAAPRFPYIEATGARINLKLDQVKTPFSLTEAEFALWLPEPRQWHLRLEAHPSRTDTNAADTGTLRVEGTLGRATTLADVPIDLHGELRDAQMGGVSQFILGRDAGLRGEMTLTAGVLGTIGHNSVETGLELTKARRADFVPPHLLAIEAHCKAIAQNNFHSFSGIECHWPPADSSDRAVLIVSGAVPDVRQPKAANLDLTVPALPTADLMDWVRVASRYPPEGLLATGTLAGSLSYSGIGQPTAAARPGSHSAGKQAPGLTGPASPWSGELDLSGETLNLPGQSTKPILLGDIALQPAAAAAAKSAAGQKAKSTQTPGPVSGFVLAPIALPLGGKEPATLEGHFDAKGYTLHLSGNVVLARLLALGDSIPQIGNGLREFLQPAGVPVAEPVAAASSVKSSGAAKVAVALSSPRTTEAPTDSLPASPVHIDLTATRAWGGSQVWTQTPAAPKHSR